MVSGGRRGETLGDADVVLAGANRLYAMGLHKAALQEYLKTSVDGGYSPAVVERIAQLYEERGEHGLACAFWERNLTIDGYGDRAVAGVVRNGVADGDTAIVQAYTGALLSATPDVVGPELVAAAAVEAEAGNGELSVRLLLRYLGRETAGEELDEVYFLLGGVYERVGPLRDLKQALACYTSVVEGFPGSSFAGRAQERVRYLNTHFFYVR